MPPSAGPPPFRVDTNDVGDFVVAAQASGGQVVVVPGNASTPQGAPLTTSGEARVAVGAAGDAAWADPTGSLHVSFRPAGTSWEAPAVLSSPLAGATIDSTGIDIAVGPSGHGVVV